MAQLFFGEDRLNDTHAHIEQAKLHAIDDAYHLGRVMELQAKFWYKQSRFKEAKSEALRAAAAYEKIGATKDIEDCRAILQNIEEAMNKPITSQMGF